MLDKLFGNVKLLQNGLDASWLRNEVIVNNLANGDTPNFKSSSVQFESVFKAALDDVDSGFQTKRTRDKHISFSGAEAAQDVSAVVVKNNNSTMRMDGNNVDVEAENVELARNTIYYYALTQQLNSEFKRLDTVIREGK